MATERLQGAGQSGFTLIEALIALSILAIAASTLMAAAAAHIERVGRLEERALAQLAAENRLTELRIAHRQPDPSTERVAMGRREWAVTTSLAATSDPALADVTISVAAAGTEDAIVTLRGFIDTGVHP